MVDEVPPQIAAPDDVTGSAPIDPVAARAAARAAYEAKRIVPAIDPNTNEVVNVPGEDAKFLKSIGVYTGDDAPIKAETHTPLAKLSALLHGAATTSSFGAYDLAQRARGKAGAAYLEQDAKNQAANPTYTTVGQLAGGAATGELRAFSMADKVKTGGALALTAFEGGAEAYNQAKALKEPVSAENVLMGAGYGLATNAVFNLGIAGASALAKKGFTGARALNDKFGVFQKDLIPEAIPKEKVRVSVKGETPPPKPSPANPVKPSAATGPTPVGTPPPAEPVISPEPEAPVVDPTAANPHPLAPDGSVHVNTLTLTDEGKVQFGQHVTKTEALNQVDDQMRRMMGRERFKSYSDSSNMAWKGRSTAHQKMLKTLSDEFPAREIDGVKYPSFWQLRQERLTMKRMNAEQFMSRMRVREKPVVPEPEVGPGGVDLNASNSDAEQPGGFNVPPPMPMDPVPYENQAEGVMHPAIQGVVEDLKNDPHRLQEQFLKTEQLWHDTLIKLDQAKAGSPEAQALKAEANQYHHAVNAIQDHMAEHDPSIKPPPGPHATKGLEWHYDDDLTLDQRKRFVGDSYNRVLGKEGEAQQAIYLNLKAKLAQIKDPAERARTLDRIAGVEKELHAQFPRLVNPETGEIIPGWRDHQKEYARLHGNEHIEPHDLEALRFVRATEAQKASIEAGELAAKEHPDMDLGEDAKTPNPHMPKETDPTGQDRTVAPEATTPASAIPDEALGPDAPGGAPGDVPGENSSAAASASPKKPEHGPYKTRLDRWKLVHLGIVSGPFKPLVHTLAALNELGPFLLNHVDDLTRAVTRMNELSNTRIGSALRHALSGTVTYKLATSSADVDAQYKHTSALLDAANANPQALEQGVRQTLGPSADQHPEFTGHAVQAISTAMTVVSGNKSRNPNEPTPRDNDYDPPRHEKVRLNRITRGVFDPATVIEDPDPDSWAAVKQVYPVTSRHIQEVIADAVANPRIKLDRNQKRRLSILMDGPISPQNSPDFIKSKQEAAIVMATPNPPGKPGSSGGPGQGNAKIGQQLASMYNPDPNMQIGGN